MLRLILNVNLFAGMKIDVEQDKFVRIVAMEDGQLVHFALKVSVVSSFPPFTSCHTDEHGAWSAAREPRGGSRVPRRRQRMYPGKDCWRHRGRARCRRGRMIHPICILANSVLRLPLAAPSARFASVTHHRWPDKEDEDHGQEGEGKESKEKKGYLSLIDLF